MPWHTSTRRKRLPPDWPQRTARVLKRDSYRCRIRLRVCIGTATEVDHIQPGDNHSMANLQAACTPCHRAKSTGEGNQAKPKRRRPPEPHPGVTR